MNNKRGNPGMTSAKAIISTVMQILIMEMSVQRFIRHSALEL